MQIVRQFNLKDYNDDNYELFLKRLFDDIQSEENDLAIVDFEKNNYDEDWFTLYIMYKKLSNAKIMEINLTSDAVDTYVECEANLDNTIEKLYSDNHKDDHVDELISSYLNSDDGDGLAKSCSIALCGFMLGFILSDILRIGFFGG